MDFNVEDVDKLKDLQDKLKGTSKVNKPMPFVSVDFIEWFADVTIEASPSTIEELDPTTQAFDAGRKSVIISLIMLKRMNEGASVEDFLTQGK